MEPGTEVLGILGGTAEMEAGEVGRGDQHHQQAVLAGNPEPLCCRHVGADVRIRFGQIALEAVDVGLDVGSRQGPPDVSGIDSHEGDEQRIA